MALTFAGVGSTGAGLVVVDYRREAKRTTPADGTGVMLVTFDPVPAGLLWLVQRVTVTTTSTTQTQAGVYAGDPTPANLVDGTNSGNLDVADQASPILVDSSVSLNVQWTGASAGAVGTVTVQYQLVQRS